MIVINLLVNNTPRPIVLVREREIPSELRGGVLPLLRISSGNILIDTLEGRETLHRD